MTKTLLHTCCAPCSVACIQLLRAEGIEPVSYWYNPNIHPYQEYKARRDTLMAYAPSVGVELIVQEDYGLRDFCRAVAEDIDHRCGHCYRLRLEQTARYAAEHGFESFSSTLFVSPYQNHELLRQTAEEVSVQYGVTFLYRDFVPVSARGSRRPASWGCICRSIAAACSVKRTATPSRSAGTCRPRKSICKLTITYIMVNPTGCVRTRPVGFSCRQSKAPGQQMISAARELPSCRAGPVPRAPYVVSW